MEISVILPAILVLVVLVVTNMGLSIYCLVRILRDQTKKTPETDLQPYDVRGPMYHPSPLRLYNPSEKGAI